MRCLFLPRHLPFLHGIIQKEINQDGVNLRIWMISENLSTNQLDAPNGTT